MKFIVFLLTKTETMPASDENKPIHIAKCDAISSLCESIPVSAFGCKSFICCVHALPSEWKSRV